MTLEVIYVTRHGFRSNWLVDHTTGQYSASIKTPTGVPSDPALTAHGVDQSKELAAHLLTVQPPIDRVYSSPYYRCLQTVEPYTRQRQEQRQHGPSYGAVPAGQAIAGRAAPPGPATTAGGVSSVQTSSSSFGSFRIRCESGLSEWYGSAPFDHPTSAPPKTLHALFPGLLEPAYEPLVIPSRSGESIDELHDRVAATMETLIAQCDADGTRSILLCTHAAVVIALGRVLTGVMPTDIEEEDFGAFTCGLSAYRRRKLGEKVGDKDNGDNTPGRTEICHDGPMTQTKGEPSVPTGDLRDGAPRFSDRRASHPQASARPRAPQWRGGPGVAGGWNCELNSACDFLSGGEERGWRFAGDESFRKLGPDGTDAGNLGTVVEGSGEARSRRERPSKSPRL
ncbi:PGAM-domain-containing protein [Thozetella sp. PMI_491]|nr:PGAM-domain-containing protein [Thozetella sp. PMI_491]